MKIIINDANILIDLIELEILPNFFGLPFKIKTTSLVLDELFDDQRIALDKFIEVGTLTLVELTDEDLMAITALQKGKPTLSTQDCSAFYQARKENGTLITSDNTLRKFAKANHLDVHGHLWVFDQMVKHGSIDGNQATIKLQDLCNRVNRKLGLPKSECQKRYDFWNEK